MSGLSLKLSILDTDIWREVLIPEDWTLAKLHKLLQVAIGWQDAHLHEFHKGKQKLSERFAVADLLGPSGSKLLYLYDFGDGWEVEVKRIADKSGDGGALPRCIGGHLAGPPEDCGGVPGYQGLVALKNKNNPGPEELETLDWAGDWEPLRFDLGEVNQQLARRFKTKSARSEPAEKAGAAKFTDRQGQYLSFIFWSTRVNRQPPSQADIQDFFGVTSAAVAGMIATLSGLGLISREAGKARNIRVLLNEADLPRLEEPDTPMIPFGPTWIRR
ncbi:hypothetical protein IV102_10985 [bacterium]|nr:hypothetical protein [bacterium]